MQCRPTHHKCMQPFFEQALSRFYWLQKYWRRQKCFRWSLWQPHRANSKYLKTQLFRLSPTRQESTHLYWYPTRWWREISVIEFCLTFISLNSSESNSIMTVEVENQFKASQSLSLALAWLRLFLSDQTFDEFHSVLSSATKHAEQFFP